MGDFVLRKKDGWVEISDLAQGMKPAVQRELWDYLAHGAAEDAVETLEIEISDQLQDRIGQNEIKDISALLVPNEILGERLMVWVRI